MNRGGGGNALLVCHCGLGAPNATRQPGNRGRNSALNSSRCALVVQWGGMPHLGATSHRLLKGVATNVLM